MSKRPAKKGGGGGSKEKNKSREDDASSISSTEEGKHASARRAAGEHKVQLSASDSAAALYKSKPVRVEGEWSEQASVHRSQVNAQVHAQGEC